MSNNYFFVTIIILSILIVSKFVIAQNNPVPSKPVVQVQRIAGLNVGFIVALIHDGLGGVWIGTEDDGVFHCQVDGKVTQFTTQNGLGDNNGYALAIDKCGRLAQQTRFDSDKPIIVTKNKFDYAGRLTNISHTDSSLKTTYADYDLTWDNGNRITDFDFTYLNGPAKRNKSNYRYDKTSQLIAANYNFMQNEMYDFDLNGNRKTAEIQGKNETYKTGEYNRLLSDENYRYEYDQEGNRISKTDKDNKTTKYFWDHRNRLVKVHSPTGVVKYIYDYQNRLVKRTQDKTETHFVHDGWQIILQFENKTIKPPHRYLWGTKQDELICDNNNWTLADHLNTIRDIVKSDGTVAAHLEYNAFGKLISETKNVSLLFSYTGKLFDKTSELQWNINRWYDSNVGKWISDDIKGFKGNDASLLRYVYNSPLIFNDFQGNAAILAILSKGAIIAGHVGTAVTFADFVMPNTSFTIQSSGNSSTIAYIVTGEFDGNIKDKYQLSTWPSKSFCPQKITVDSEIIVYDSDIFNTSNPTALKIHNQVSFQRNKADKKFIAKFGARLSLSCRNITNQTCVMVSVEGGGIVSNWTEVCDWGGDIELYFKFKIDYTAWGKSFSEYSSSYIIGGPENKFIGKYTCI